MDDATTQKVLLRFGVIVSSFKKYRVFFWFTQPKHIQKPFKVIIDDHMRTSNLF